MTLLRWVLCGSALLKGIDALQFDQGLGVAWICTAVLISVHERSGCALLAVVALTGAAFDLRRMSNHVVFLGWIGLIFALWGDRASRLRLLHTQLCVVYFFAGFSKLNPDFLSGSYVAARQAWLPFPRLLSLGAIAIEWLLCAAVWARWRYTLPVAAVFHAVMLSVWTVDFFGHGPGLLVFNVAIVATIAAVIPWQSAAPGRETQTNVSIPGRSS